MKYELPKLPYSYLDLEPYIDSKTMEIHYSKHHAGYVTNLNSAIGTRKDFKDVSLENLLKNLSSIPKELQNVVRNNGGGHYNHSLFWKILKKDGGGKPKGKLRERINESFESFDLFKEEFTTSSLTRFGSGWAWLVLDSSNKLKVVSTPNQDNPLMDSNDKPILCLDVWEHAYYLKYQNRRAEYIEAFWNIVNWNGVEENMD